jgi:hypothetical protein
MAIVFPATLTQPPIPDGTVIRMYNRGAATGLTPAGAGAPLESQTMTSGTCTFSTPVDGQVYAFAVVAGVPYNLNRWLLKSNATTSQANAHLTTTGATPETRRTAMKAAASIVQT